MESESDRNNHYHAPNSLLQEKKHIAANNKQMHFLKGNNCSVCGAVLKTCQEKKYNVFSKLYSERNMSHMTVLHKMCQIVGKEFGNLNSHVDLICEQCFCRLVDHEETKQKLQKITLDIREKFKNISAVYCTPIIKCAVKENITKQKNLVKRYINKEGETIIKKEYRKTVAECSKTENKEPYKTVNTLIVPASKQYRCPICNKIFQAYSHRVEHMLIHLGEKPWSCSECKKSFRTKGALKVHSLRHTGERPFSCVCCEKSFTHKSYLEEHYRIHSGEKPFVCHFCEHHFRRKKELIVHLKVHTGDKHFFCRSCPKSFAVKSRLERHSLVHLGDKPYICKYCSKTFARKDECKVHERQHTGERPYHCQYCDKRFTNRSNCVAHVRIHTGLRHYSCTVCNKTYSRKMKLKEHMAQKHALKQLTIEENTVEKDTEQYLLQYTDLKRSALTNTSSRNEFTDTHSLIQIGSAFKVESILSKDCQPVLQIPVTYTTHISLKNEDTAYFCTIPTTDINNK